MRQVVLISLSVLVLSHLAICQTQEIDSLRTELSNSQPNELRVDILRVLIAKTYISGDSKGAFY